MLINNLLSYYCDEEPDIARNPFKHTTRIDCEKVFITTGVDYDERLRTSLRPDISEALYENIREKLLYSSPQEIELEESELMLLNWQIRRIS